MSNAASMNSSANRSTSAANSAMPVAPSAMTNSNAAARSEAEENLKTAPKAVEPLPAAPPLDLAKSEAPAASGAAPAKEEPSLQANADEREKQQPQNSIAQNQTVDAVSSRRAADAPAAAMRAESKAKKTQAAKDDAEDKSGAAAATTIVGGKTFRRDGNVWYDAAYRGQATINIARGTKEYKKLDSGLRVIVENLGGAVVIVWKERAYRIQ